jgi:flagellar hook assembly protein FlgD
MIVNDSQWEISPEIFSPNNDGYDDYLQISYKLSEVGNTVNINVYDSRGRIIRRLVDGKLLELQGSIIWDGIDDNGNKASIGIYIIYIELVNLNGNVEHQKMSAVIGG